MHTLYLGCSLVIGLLQIFDAFVLWSQDGKLSRLTKVFSFVELCWAAATLRAGREQIVAAWLTQSYLYYFGGMTVIGLFLHGRMARQGLPRQLIAVGGGFGVYFAVASGVLLALD